MKIAVAGKGGSGKTTIAGTLARALVRRGERVLAIDGDTSPNLGITLGIAKDNLGGLQPLPSSILQRVTDASGKNSAALTMSLDEIKSRFGFPVNDRLILLEMARVDHAGAG